MDNLTTRIQRVTSKGQITLPSSWRKKNNTNTIVVTNRGDVLEIKSAKLEKKDSKEYTVFDAIRDNKGKGIKAKDLQKILKGIDS
jgi:bifunctional DNA-binding transcriptional regulator/antitoxin component of YhaV-PrlF toxin-antitoxin module